MGSLHLRSGAFFFCLRTTEHAFGPEAAATGGVGIADAVFLVLFKQLAVAAVEAGCEFKIVKLSAEGLVFLAVPDFGQGLLHDIAVWAGPLGRDIYRKG